MIVSCEATPCPVILSATCVFYKGENLIYTGINMNDNLQTALEKIDGKFQDAGIGYIFENGIIQLNPGEPVRLGGSLMQNTTINSAGFTFTLSGTFEASALITTGGTASDFVKGDGSLDSTSYQPAGSYITALTGDGTASGPGSVPLTLATVNANPGTYGSALAVPVVTVNAKGLVTNITPVSISLPAGTIILVGDVSAVGATGAPITATLATVNSNIYGTNTFLKFAVNAKGLVTSAAPVTLGDLTSVLGFMPVPDSRTLTINGLTRDLTADRTWSVGTVTSVQVAVPPAFSVTTAPITSFGTINIAATGNTSQYIRGDGSLAAFPAIPTTSGTSGSSGSSGISSVDTNIYNSDGTLTGNRIITLDSKQLVYRDSNATLQNYTFTIGTPTGIYAPTWPSSIVYEAQYNMTSAAAEPYNTRVWGRNQGASTRALWVNQVYSEVTFESTGGGGIYNQYFSTSRGSQLDTSTASVTSMLGVQNIVGHRHIPSSGGTSTQINTTNQYGIINWIENFIGNITNAYGSLSRIRHGYSGISLATTMTNYYAFYADAFIGATGGTATVSNYYGLYLNTPTVGATGTITNRWGVYAPNSTMTHYLNGSLLVGTNVNAGFKVDINGTARVNTDMYIHNSGGEARLEVGRSLTGPRVVFYSDYSAGLVYYDGVVFSNYVYLYNGITNILSFQTNGVNRLTIDSIGAATFSSSVKTGTPAGGTAQPWKFGQYNTTAPAATGYVEVEVNGVLYKLLAST